MWNKVVPKDHFASHFIRDGEQCVTHNAHLFNRSQRKKGTDKIQSGMHACMLKYHCICNYNLVYHTGLREVCFLNSDCKATLDF